TSARAMQLPWNRYVVDDSISGFSIDSELQRSTTGDNLTVQCNVTRWCRSAYVDLCSAPDTVRWFTPWSLPPADTGLRKAIDFSSQVVASHIRRANITGEISQLNITSTLRLRRIGFIHAGLYECSTFFEQQPFTLQVHQNAAGSCDFADQCSSGSCWSGSCRC